MKKIQTIIIKDKFKYVALLVVSLLWFNVGFAENITLHKCRDSADEKMDPTHEKNYYNIDLKNKKLTSVVVRTDEFFLNMQKATEKYPELKNTLVVNKSIVGDYIFYYDDENIVKARFTETYGDGIKLHVEQEVHLKTFKVYSTTNITNKYKSSVNRYLQNQTQCDLKK